MTSRTYTTFATCLLALSIQANVSAKTQVIEINAALETRSHFADSQGNFTDVDDPAIWIHPTKKKHSIVITALKKGGLDVYDLNGKLVQHIVAAKPPKCYTSAPCENNGGRLNNVEVVYNFKINNVPTDIVVASDRGLDTLAIFAVETDNKGKTSLKEITADGVPLIFASNQAEINEGQTAYGLATVTTDKTMAFVTQNSTTSVAQLELFADSQGKVNYRSMTKINFPSAFALPSGGFWTPCSDDDGELPHFEGLVTDPQNDTLFLAQEDVGIWKTSLSKPNDVAKWKLFAKVKKYGVPYTRTWNPEEEEYTCTLDYKNDPGYGSESLRADAEGLTLYDGGDGKGYLLASSQGNNTIAVYERENDNQYINSFTVADGLVDGVNETDGMMVVNANLGGKFDQGLLVMQDGINLSASNDDDMSRENSNFKYVAWRDIAKELGLKVNTKDLSRK